MSEFKQRVLQRFGPRITEIKIFGSTVRGERRLYSDIDILILIENLTAEEKRWVWDEATHINIEKDTILSPLVMTPEEFQKLRDRERRIALDIDREGVSL
ncbi:MAG: nucleotidyltransferase domain-containing protein [Deltaproteobacteria bacterium]|nr:nucleotidyltransferase domain-containing protein [Deltaproteobacteria bacterium]